LNSALPNPFISILIRSRNRLPQVKELLDICLDQDYVPFEVVIIEQSDAQHRAENSHFLKNLNVEHVRVVETVPLGPAGARNVGSAHCHGEVVLFIDDDDLPLGNNWIAYHARHYMDPNCIGVSGRYVHDSKEVMRYNDPERAYKSCLSYSFFLRGRDFTGIDKIKIPVQWLHGSNASIRRQYILDLGGWYPHLNDCEEHSFCFKLKRVLKRDEYLLFDPGPKCLRRYQIHGGIGRRSFAYSEIIEEWLKYYHWVVAKYYPFRFYGLYPLFMLYAFNFATRWYRIHNLPKSQRERKFWKNGSWKREILKEMFKLPFSAGKFLILPRPSEGNKSIQQLN